MAGTLQYLGAPQKQYLNYVFLLLSQVLTCTSVACVAGGIVRAHGIEFWQRGRQVSSEAVRRMGSGTLKYCLHENHRFFNSLHTRVWEKRIG